MWVFGYGSLMWNPGFEAVERRVATLAGWHRSFCMHSIHYRGTAERPGLVLALDEGPGASCAGLAFRVTPGTEDETLAYLRTRELISDAYRERTLDITLVEGGRVEAVTYVIDRDHPQYATGIAREDQARIIASAVGQAGPNTEYLFNTAAHLRAEGLADPEIDWLCHRVRALMARAL